ncbi:MAG: hypothetical protein LUO98_01555 [Methanoregula sp.]|nr:hypothetical protein [Methanoregula sp.]
MKTKVLTLIGILIIAFAAMVAPVMAADTDSGTAIITGDVAQTITLTPPAAPIALTLDPTLSPATDSGSDLGVSSNYPDWVVTAEDLLDSGKPALSDGIMVNWVMAGPGPYGTTLLASPLELGTADGTGYTGSALTALTAQFTFAQGDGTSAAADIFTIPLDLSQPVAYTDVVLPATETYQIIVTFTGTTP